MMKPGDRLGQKVPFETIFRKEIEKLGKRAATPFNAQAVRERADRDLDSSSIGLSLSGGGIRSAAFSLGVLQSLEAAGCFNKIDYLSTVSGGGYTGSALIAALKRSNGEFPFKTNTGEPTDPTDIADNEAVYQLRDRSRYLMPHGRFDLVVSLAIILRGLTVNAIIVFCAVFTAASLTLFLFPDECDLARSHFITLLGGVFPDFANKIHSLLGNWFVMTKLLLLTSGMWLVLWAVFRSISTTAIRATTNILSDPGSLLARGTGLFFVSTAVIALLEAQPFLISEIIKRVAPSNAWLTRFFDLRTLLIALVAASGAAVAWQFLIQMLQGLERDASWPALLKKLGANTVLFVIASALPLLIYATYLFLVIAGLNQNGTSSREAIHLPPLLDGQLRSLWIAIPILIVAAYIALQRLWGPLPDTLFNLSWLKVAALRGWPFYTGLGTVLIVVALGYAFSRWFATALVHAMPQSDAAWAYAAAAGVLSLIVFLFTENANSLHRLYRDRLEDAFALRGVAEERMLLSHLKNLDDGKTLRPYPIINATVNIKASSNNRRARNADFFIFTPHSVGSDATGYAETEAFEQAEPHMDLATAVAVSGAAISSAMGRVGISALGPTLTLLNLRLGLWVRNPFYARTQEDRTAASRGDLNFFYMVREFFGHLTDTSKKVYVTDGGHIDNLGLRQLLKRRCEIIIVSDAEQDPSMTFGSFVDAERFSRIDLGVRFDLPLDSIREAGLRRRAEKDKALDKTYRSPASAHAAIGKINYPASAGGAAPKEGIILYIKASVTGDEREYILDYERRYPQFPHEPTGDQFFTEEQFEVYRALGFHATAGALTYSDGTERWREMLEKFRSKMQMQSS